MSSIAVTSEDFRVHDRPVPAADAAPALVHDYLLVMRGAERTFAAMAECWPGAPVYTLLFDADAVGSQFSRHSICVSNLQKLGLRQGGFRVLLPLFPQAVERLPIQGHKLVISSSSAFAHGVRPDEDAVHICYCHTPFRYVWHEREQALAEIPRPFRPVLRRVLGRIQAWDRRASQRVTHYIANSDSTRRRIQEYWGRDAPVIHPPVDVDRFRPGTPEDFFLIVTELVPHKRIELALEAARRAGVHIKVVGGGTDERRLRTVYGEHADFLGRIDDAALAALYPRARALVMPNVEEFGITAVEAQAAGRPVVAAAAGGALETIVDGKTGILVPPGDLDALTDVFRDEALSRFDPAASVANAQHFSIDTFKSKMRAQVASALGRAA